MNSHDKLKLKLASFLNGPYPFIETLIVRTWIAKTNKNKKKVSFDYGWTQSQLKPEYRESTLANKGNGIVGKHSRVHAYKMFK